MALKSRGTLSTKRAEVVSSARKALNSIKKPSQARSGKKRK